MLVPGPVARIRRGRVCGGSTLAEKARFGEALLKATIGEYN